MSDISKKEKLFNTDSKCRICGKQNSHEESEQSCWDLFIWKTIEILQAELKELKDKTTKISGSTWY